MASAASRRYTRPGTIMRTGGLLLHHTNLDAGCMRTQQRSAIGLHIKGILRITRWMIGWCVQRIKTVVLILNLRAIRHHKTQLAKAFDDILGHLREWM